MAIQYYMRAFNTTLSQYVDWVVNDTPDSTGTFSGYPANQLINITVNRVVQSKVHNFLKPNQSRGGTDGYFYHVNSYDWINATAPGTGTPLTYTGFAIERGVTPVSAISTASNTSPINVTTATPHGLVTGQIVTIIGVTGNINANGTWPITVTGSSNFTLNGSTGSGAPNNNTGNVYTPANMSTLIWDEVNQLWRFVVNTNGDGVTLGSSQSVKVLDFLIDGYEALGSPTASQGIIRLPNGSASPFGGYIFGRNVLNTGDVQLIGVDTFVTGTGSSRIKIGGLSTDVTYYPGVIQLDGYLEHTTLGVDGTTVAQTGFIRDQNATTIVAFRNQLGTGDITTLSSNSLNNIIVGDANNTGIQFNTATGDFHQFQVGSVPQVEIGTAFIRFDNGVVLPVISQTVASIGVNGQSLTVQAQNAASSGTATGGNLNLTSGSGIGAPNGVVNLQTAGATRIVLSDTTETYNIPNITFASPVVTPTISQTITTGAGTNMYIVAQGSSLSTGGNLYLSSGLGNTVANDGYTVLQAGSISQMVVSAINYPTGYFKGSQTNGKVIILGNLEVQGTTTTVDSTTVDIVGPVIHGNWSDPATSPNVSIPSTVVGYSSHRGNISGNPRDGASLIWTEGATASNGSYGVTSTAGLFASDGYWRAISTPGDGFGSDGYTSANSFATLSVFGNNFVASFDPNPALGTIPGAGNLRNTNNVAAVTARNLTASTTLVVSGSTPLALPQGTLNVVSTAGFTTPTGTLFVQSSTGTQTITYTNTTGTSFTGCVGGTGNIVTGGIVGQAVQTTTIAAFSNGQTVPGVGNIISVASTVGFPQTGTLRVVTYGPTNLVPGNGSGIISINYTGISGNTFTGCSVATGSPTGSGVLYTGNTVQLASIAGNSDIHLLGSDFGNHILHGSAGLANSGHIFNTATGGVYDFWVNSISQIQLGNADIDSDGYTETVQVSPTVSNPRIYQLTQPYTGSNAGFNLMLQAQAGQNVTAGTNNPGGNLILASGAAGTGGTAGVAGTVGVNTGTVQAAVFNTVDPDADGYVEWLGIGSTVGSNAVAGSGLRLFQFTQPGTGANNGFNFKINAQAGQQQTGGNNNNNGGNLAFASGVPGTGGGGTAGSPGQIEFLWGSVLELTLTDGSLQWSNLTTTNPIFSQAATNVASAIGQSTTLQAQNATGTTSTGGALNLTSGTGTTANGAVNLQSGGTTVLQVTNTTLVTMDGTTFQFASTVTSPTINQATTGGASGQTLTLQAQNATTTGGNLALTSGTGTTAGNVQIQTGAATRVLVTPTFTSFSDTAEALRITPVSAGTTLITFASTDTAATINQTTTGSATGATLTVQAQNAATTGGNAVVTSGTGGTTAGNVLLETGGTARVTVTPTNTQFADTATALTVTPVSAGTTQITFAATDTAAQINQTATLSATGATMTVAAQNAATTGGNLFLTSGFGTTDGYVALQTGGTTVASAVPNKFVLDQGWRRHVTSISGTYQVLVTDDYIAITSISAPFTITMPSAPTLGDTYTFKDASGTAATNNVTISGNGNNIDGTATITLSQNYSAVVLTFTGTTWSIN